MNRKDEWTRQPLKWLKQCLANRMTELGNVRVRVASGSSHHCTTRINYLVLLMFSRRRFDGMLMLLQSRPLYGTRLINRKLRQSYARDGSDAWFLLKCQHWAWVCNLTGTYIQSLFVSVSQFNYWFRIHHLPIVKVLSALWNICVKPLHHVISVDKHTCVSESSMINTTVAPKSLKDPHLRWRFPCTHILTLSRLYCLWVALSILPYSTNKWVQSNSRGNQPGSMWSAQQPLIHSLWVFCRSLSPWFGTVHSDYCTCANYCSSKI